MAAPSHPPATAPPPAPIAAPLPGVAHAARAATKTTNTKDFRIKIPSTGASSSLSQSHDFVLLSPLQGACSSLVVSSAPRSRVSYLRTGRSSRDELIREMVDGRRLAERCGFHEA